ncbi:CPBP family intramembrane glutamic endopeptidase [Lacrimispora amygdalina]|uniref:CPBP family intramembrane glutamic endopeptidase n=1 Tax=Lacrimispora amygdalina TaxID=253257 RepID=UPI000BE309D3|nr:CPBP family intramembrane glutamic endopeptidase [Lacrimispora amygdalina]
MEHEKLAAKKRLIIFIALTIILAWIVFLLAPICGLTYGSGAAVVILSVAMFMPALSNLLTRLITKEGFGNMYLRPHFKGHVKEYLLLYFGPTVLLLLSGALYFLIFPGSFDPELTTLKGMVASSGKQGLDVSTLLIVQTLIFVVIGPLVNIIPTMGEELGWRGYLLPKLRIFLSDRTALIITGALWGIWHLPVIMMGHNYGTGYWGYPWLGILAMIVFCVALGIIEGYISIKLESVIPAAMIHSTVNAGAALPIIFAKSGYNPILGPAITGLIGGLPFIVLAVILLIKAGRKMTLGKNEALRQEEGTLGQK